MNKILRQITTVVLSAAEVLAVASFGGVSVSAASGEINPDTIAVGENHSLVIRNNMTLWAAGDNSSGQLGVGDKVESSEGVEVMKNVVFVDANDDVSFAIDTNGTLYGWGDNSNGQISPNLSNYVIFKPTKLLDNVVAVSAGDTHTLAITSDGTAYGWGSNAYGELGFEANIKRNGVTEIKKNVTDIAAGDGFSMLVTKDGALYSCGNNTEGQLGIGSYTDKEEPVVSVSSGVSRVEAGNSHAVILKTDGTVWTSGVNYDGELGLNDDRIGSKSFISTKLTNISEVFAGGYSSGAISKTGSLYTWGNNDEGQLHNSKNVDAFAPETISSGAASIAFGEHHSLMLKTSGSVSSAGSGVFGELFAESETGSVLKPTKVSAKILDYSAGSDHAAMIDENGVLYTWGRNDYGQLGTGNTVNSKKPAKVTLGEKALRVWCGNKVTFVQGEKNVFVFGSNGGSMLGMPTKAANVVNPTVNPYLSGASQLEIYPANGFCLALMDGEVFGWGKNKASRLMSLSSITQEPTALGAEIGKITKLAVGGNHVLALVGDKVYGWGSNGSAQLGMADIYIIDSPIEIYLTNSKNEVVADKFSDIAAGGDHSILLDTTGNAWTIGGNSDGQLGTDTYRVKSAYNAANGVRSVLSGEDICGVIYENGNLSLCGNNTFGALGNGSVRNISKFGTVTGKDVSFVSIGNGFAGYIDVYGTLFCWGDNTYSQVGNGSGGSRIKPATVINDALCSVVNSVKEITLNKTALTLPTKGTEKLTATITPADAVNTALTWESSNTKVATVASDGTITAIAGGKATITAKAANGVSAKCEVTVTVPVTSVSVSPSKSKTLSIGKSFSIKTKVYPTNADDKTLTFKSTNEDVAVVSASGKVTALSAGKAEIVVTPNSNPEKAKKIVIKVRPAKVTVTSRKATTGGVVLKWKDAEGADGYEVFRKVSGSSAKSKSIGDAGDVNSFVDDTAVKGKTYVYNVRSYVIIDGVKVYCSSYTQYKITAK